MQRAELKEILQCLPRYKTRFYYFKDRYALLLLNLAVATETSKKELKSTRFARLLEKDIVKTTLAQCRGRALTGDDFEAYWPARYECYYLTLGAWGSKHWMWNQTSRRGYNLVLQLNFSSEHDEPYRKLVDPEDDRPFEFGGHPVAKGPLHTLAWSRMDIDLAKGEALIEEIQNDWIREALWARRMAVRQRGPYFYWGSKRQNERVIRYVDSILRQHEAIWDEAMLSATIWFLRRELGISSIYYHSHETGASLKKISGSLPPRSLYTKLPRKFCFAETKDVPGFLHCKTKSALTTKRLDQARFYSIAL